MMLGQGGTPDARLGNATGALREIMGSPDRRIPQDLIARSQCVVVVPDLLKGAFLVGGKYGRGFASCRRGGGWSAPAAVRIEGGSFGFQLGGSATDLVMLVMNRHGMDRLLGDKFTIGGDAAAAAGPVGRDTIAQTDVLMRAELLSWSRSRGLFAGISLDGATLRPDSSENRKLYGRRISNREILETAVAAPRQAQPFLSELALISRAEVLGVGGGGDRSGVAPSQPASTEATPLRGSAPAADRAMAPIPPPLPQSVRPLAADQPPPQLPANKPHAATAPPEPLPSQSAFASPTPVPLPDRIAAAPPTISPGMSIVDGGVSPVQSFPVTQTNSIPVVLLYEIALGVLVVAAASSILLSRRSRLAGMVPPPLGPPPPPATMPPVPPPLPPMAQSAPPQAASRPTS
jgi:lipid-binding SYLF domain-containing protein